ncbi:hypothetical protein G6F43_006683 [Rhizopus delemar]|nr:hypothetical protein G6F43_006683 [Rhizopus delemar]
MNTNNITNISDDLKTFRAIPLPAMANTFDLPDVEDSCDIDEAENLRLAEYLQNIQKYYNSFNNIYQQEMNKIKFGMRMHTLSKMEDAMKRSVANISDVDEDSASLPPKQRQQFFLSYNIIKIKLQKFHLSSIK